MTVNLPKKVHLPDMPSVSAPDIGHITEELRELAGAAADAVSSAAARVPGVKDHRAAARRRRMYSFIGVVAFALVMAAVIRRRRDDDAAAREAAQAR